MVSQSIRKIRLIKNLKQEHLAERLGISLKTYQKMESGETPVSVDRLDKIAEVFEMTASEILDMPSDTLSFHNTQHDNKKAVVINHQAHAAEVEALKSHIHALEGSLRQMEASDRFQKDLIAQLMAGRG